MPRPLAALEGLAVTPEAQTRLTRLFEVLLDAVPALYARLPQQPIHSDYWPSNVLMAHGRVSGVLDFEFTAPDLRVMDLAIGLGAFGGLRQSGDLAAMRAFGAAYLARSPLRLEELAALPVLFRLALAASLVHRIGRMREGLATAAVLERVDGLIAADAWLEAHGEQLVTELQREVA